MATGVNTSFRFNPELKSEFKELIEKDGLDMTELFEGFMRNYIKIKKNE